MKEDLHDIDKLFKEGIDQHGLPGYHIWEAVERDLDKKKVVILSKRYNRMKGFAIVLLLLLGVVTTYVLTRETPGGLAGNEAKDKQLADGNNGNTLDEVVGLAKLSADAKRRSAEGDKADAGNKGRIHDEESNEKHLPMAHEAGNDLEKNEIDNKKEKYENGLANVGNIHKPQVLVFSKKRNTSNSKISTNRPPITQPATASKQFSGNQIERSTARQKRKENRDFTVNTLDENKVDFKLDGSIIEPKEGSGDLKRKPVSELKVFRDENNNTSQRVNTLVIRPVPIDVAALKHQSALTISDSLKQVATTYKNGTPVKISTASGRLKMPVLVSFGAYYSPDLSFNKLKNDHPHGPDNDREHIRHDERHDYSYSAGINAGFQIAKHITIQAGVAYSRTTFDVRPKNLLAERDNNGQVKYRIDASIGYGYILPRSDIPPNEGDTLRGVKAMNTVEYIQVPLLAQYEWKLGRVGISASAGTSLNMLASGSIYTSVDEQDGNGKESETVGSVKGLNKFAMTGLFGLGVSYSINKFIAFEFSPTARIALTPINSGTTVKSYPNTFGLAAGVRFKLK